MANKDEIKTTAIAIRRLFESPEDRQRLVEYMKQADAFSPVQNFSGTQINLLNGTELAKAMKVHPNYVTAMKRAGYKFQFSHQTTLEHAMQWRAEHPDFTVSAAYPGKGRPRVRG